MDHVVLQASVRTETGKKIGKQLRREGQVPAVVYGEGHPPTSLVTKERELSKVLHAGGNVLITLKVTRGDGTAEPDRTVLITEVQQHPVTTQILHVDFHQVSLTKQIEVVVPLQFTGEAIGVKQDGGRLDHLLWEVRVKCLPTQIPKSIAVEVSALTIGDSLLVKDLVVPAGVTIINDPQVAVAACLQPFVEKAPEVAAEGAAPAEPEVIKQKKPEAEEAAAGGEAKGAKPEKAEKSEKAGKSEKEK